MSSLTYDDPSDEYRARRDWEEARDEARPVSKIEPGAVERYADRMPPRLLEGLVNYVDRRIPTGDFLRAVLENDLKEAVGRADEESLAALLEFVRFLYNECPSACWGSPEKVAAWLAGANQ